MGVLPVFLGHATRMVEYHLADEKAYRASVVLGARSSTDDIDGELTLGEVAAPARAEVAAALGDFQGSIVQVPPDHSAVHVEGRRAYQLARQGERPLLPPRDVTIHALELVDWDEADPARPVAVIDVRCSAGTYVRALARDLGARLGCGAYLGALTRTASGPFRLTEAHPLEQVREALAAGRSEVLLVPMDTGLESIPALRLAPADREALGRGQVIRLREAGTWPVPAVDAPRPRGEAVTPGAGQEGRLMRVVDDTGCLVAMARERGGRLYPDKVFITPDDPGH
jgi:tRNA pseudouridine55 synthase